MFKLIWKCILILILLNIIFAILFSIFVWNPIKFDEKNKDFIWNWTWSWIYLNIYENWYLEYKNNKWFLKTSVNWPITKISDDNITVNVIANINFKIDKKPYINWKNYEMIIDWNLLKRKYLWLAIPEKEKLEKLILTTLKDFNLWLKEKSFNILYSNISELFKKQFNVDKINKTFEKLTINNVNLDDFLSNKIIISKDPFIDKYNLLNIEWYVLNSDWIKFVFNLEYTYEYPEWKLIWINTNIITNN